MPMPDQSVTLLLEQYLFAVADKLIGRVGKQQQDELIDLLSSLETSSLPGEPSQPPGLTSADPTAAVSQSPLASLAEQWQEALSVSAKPTLNDDYSVYLLGCIDTSQRHIDATRLQIARMGQLIDRHKETMIKGVTERSMLYHYQLLRADYIIHLGRMETIQQTQIRTLNDYQKSKGCDS